jgi:hypothetical protein
MPVITTYRIIIVVMIWLYHLGTSLNINAGYYVNPFLQQPLILGHNSVPQLIWSTYDFSGHNTVTTRDRTTVDNENQAKTREDPVVDCQNQAVTRENPIVDNQNKVMTLENPVIDNHNYTMTRETPVVDNQNYPMARENTVVVSQDQNLEDYSFKHMQPKCSSCPHRGTEELTHRGGDSTTSVQQGESDDKHVSGGGDLVGNRTNHISIGSTSKLLPTAADPSRCVWAIISCCSPGSSNVRNPCFELLGCPGPFWDTKPCNEKITGAALKVVGEFYSNGKRE